MPVHAIALVLALGLIAGSPAVAAQDLAPPQTRQLELAFDADGRVTLRARNVAVRDILAEWARQCGCFVVNAHDLTARVDLPMQFEQKPQEQVLDALLRQAAGYVLTPRRDGASGPSRYETIYVLATSNPSAASAYVAPPPLLMTPVVSPTPGTPEDELLPVTPIATLPDDPSSPPISEAADAPPPPPPVPRSPGTPGRFVPIVPIGPGSSAPRATPGGVTPAPNQAPQAPQREDD
jgi:hypothetical protein